VLRYYDRDGHPVESIQAVAILAEDPSYRTLCQTWVGCYFVSTVWLFGLDHSFGVGEPLLFETMVFTHAAPDIEVDYHDLDCRRWTTFDEAVQGHQEIVSLIMATADVSELTTENLLHAEAIANGF
jgi:hypothetical protein